MPRCSSKAKERKTKVAIDCNACKTQSDCCMTGSWVDLEEAKKIAGLGLKGEFFQLQKDKSFPSGYRIGTGYGLEPCTFLDPDGLCSIHKIDYGLKPKSCKEFPYERNELAPFVDELCTLYRCRIKNKKKK